jgi:hypothetical protein
MTSNDDRVPDRAGPANDGPVAVSHQTPRLVASWLVVGVPLVYGIYQTISKTLPLFGG